MLAVQHQHIQQQIRIHWIVLGTGRIQRRAKLRGGTRMDGVQMQVGILAQHEHQGAMRLLQRHRDGLAGEARRQHRHPSPNGLGCMLHFACFPLIGTSSLQRPSMFLVGPVNALQKRQTAVLQGNPFGIIGLPP